VAIVGDGAMMMMNEINTASAYGIDAVWIVLNDARYGMIAQGMESIGWTPFEVDFPRADFVPLARALGAQALSVRSERECESALRTAMAARGPFVLDVWIDPDELAPAGRRNQSLAKQGVGR
jgi:acetolactate synthase-1/2/3 large subunit